MILIKFIWLETILSIIISATDPCIETWYHRFTDYVPGSVPKLHQTFISLICCPNFIWIHVVFITVFSQYRTEIVYRYINILFSQIFQSVFNFCIKLFYISVLSVACRGVAFAWCLKISVMSQSLYQKLR